MFRCLVFMCRVKLSCRFVSYEHIGWEHFKVSLFVCSSLLCLIRLCFYTRFKYAIQISWWTILLYKILAVGFRTTFLARPKVTFATIIPDVWLMSMKMTSNLVHLFCCVITFRALNCLILLCSDFISNKYLENFFIWIFFIRCTMIASNCAWSSVTFWTFHMTS